MAAGEARTGAAVTRAGRVEPRDPDFGGAREELGTDDREAALAHARKAWSDRIPRGAVRR